MCRCECKCSAKPVVYNVTVNASSQPEKVAADIARAMERTAKFLHG